MKKISKFFACLVLSLAFFNVAISSAYAAMAGRIQFVFGSVQLIDATGKARQAQKGDAVNEADTIVTAQKSSAQVKMQDGGFVAVRPESQLRFDQYAFAGKQDGNEKAFFSLLKGGFRAVTGLIGRVNKQNYKIQTLTATIGIRGTDHETFLITPDSPLAKIAPTGTYNKVNVGETSMTTDKGSIVVQPNQMGFAGGMDQVPQVQPVNVNLFTVAKAEAPEAKEEKKEEKKEDKKADAKQDEKKEDKKEEKKAEAGKSDAQGKGESSAASARGGADADSGRYGARPALAASSFAASVGTFLTPVSPVIVQTSVTAANGTVVNLSNQTATTSTGTTVSVSSNNQAYVANNIAIELSMPNMYWWGQGFMAAPTGITYAGAGLASFTDMNFGGSMVSNLSYSVIGGNNPITSNATSFAMTGIQFGRWASASALQESYVSTMGKNSGAPASWMYGAAGYLDSASVLAGAYTYALDGSNAPHDGNSGQTGTLTSASLSANFTSQTVTANLGLTLGSKAWSLSTTAPVTIFNGQFNAYASPGTTANTMTILGGAVGGTLAACTTCGGNLYGAFTGHNYAGAILAYQVWDNSATTGVISGEAAFARTGGATVVNGTAAATGKYFVATGGGNLQLVDAITTTGGVLTSYRIGSAGATTSYYDSITVNCTTCTANATNTSAATGVYFGTWDAGTYSQTWSNPLSGGSLHWINGPEAGPLFLPNALTVSKTYTFDGGMVTNANGVAGTVLGTTALNVDFTRQVVGINIDLSVSDTVTASLLHTWNAKTTTGNEVALTGNQGIGSAGFYVSTYNGASSQGALTVTVDGTASGSGSVRGQLTGTGLNGAIMSYSLSSSAGQQVNGVAALSSSVSDVATPHRPVLVSLDAPSASSLTGPTLGYYENAPARISASGSNLTKFDMHAINNGNGGSQSVAIGSSVIAPASSGSDPVSGISWGRWDGGSINVTNRATGVVTPNALSGSLHWIAGPTETAAVTLPTSGTYTYTYAGGTAPTDNLGNTGSLNSATLSANFTTQTVNVGVNVSVAGANMIATAANAPILQRTAFYADSQVAASSATHLVVTCIGACGTSASGVIVGGFTGVGASGAMMTYGLEKVGGANAAVISGVAAFHH